MPTSESFLSYIHESLSLTDHAFRAMMGEYILYCQGKVVGGLYDDRLLVKPTPAALRLLPDARKALPYEGAKPLLLVEETDDGRFLKTLIEAIAADLPSPKPKKSKKSS